ncbi:hypothetical protein METSCH_C07320 [Metschnikowia aff. pulcherrima]|uniref:Uncharacterized protein n=1 Tax=Metschnikowia aff. pulcherrima TaxID=2163413 RepID=A0A4P6XMT6_9ASCO|nr:hypothetical protein METSCH_C07320 [Metschnikowia aff. pulcherrima]
MNNILICFSALMLAMIANCLSESREKAINKPAQVKRGFLSCIHQDPNVPQAEMKIFRKYFTWSDDLFFERYSNYLARGSPEGPNPVGWMSDDLQEKLRDMKSLVRAISKVVKALEKIQYLSMSMPKQSRQLDVIIAARYILVMWDLLFPNIHGNERVAFEECFDGTELPFSSVENLEDTIRAAWIKLATITTEESR